jgi:hypothetical protein
MQTLANALGVPLSDQMMAQIASLLKTLIDGASVTYEGTRYDWNTLIQTILVAVDDYKEAAATYEEAGEPAKAELARAASDTALTVYNNLAELYREWPELGLEGQLGAALGVAWPAALVGVAAITGVSLIGWARMESFKARTMLDLTREVRRACANLPTNEEECNAAREAAGMALAAIREGTTIRADVGAKGAAAAVGIGALALVVLMMWKR